MNKERIDKLINEMNGLKKTIDTSLSKVEDKMVEGVGKDLKNTIFLKCLHIIEEASNDDRNYVRKAVNWALRQIGKRNLFLRDAALKTAKKILKRNTKN